MSELLQYTGFVHCTGRELAMLAVACLVLYLAVARSFEPRLLIPIGFGALLVNLPLGELLAEPEAAAVGGLFRYLGQGFELRILTALLFLALGALTDFGPVLANPKTLLLAGAAQLGVFATFVCAHWAGFSPQEAASIGSMGGGDGAISIYLSAGLAPHLVGPVAVAAYTYMALVPRITPPLMRLLTTRRERSIRMPESSAVPRWLRVTFPIAATVVCGLLVPAVSAPIGLLMFGNLLRECGVTEQLNAGAQNELFNLVTILLGLAVGATMSGEHFWRVQSLHILALGWVAFVLSTASGLLAGKLLAHLPGTPVNPLIGGAGIAVVPLAARVAQDVGHEVDPDNHLLAHALAPNVFGVVAGLLAAGALATLIKL